MKLTEVIHGRVGHTQTRLWPSIRAKLAPCSGACSIAIAPPILRCGVIRFRRNGVSRGSKVGVVSPRFVEVPRACLRSLHSTYYCTSVPFIFLYDKYCIVF